MQRATQSARGLERTNDSDGACCLLTSAGISNSCAKMSVRLNKIAAIHQWECLGAPESGHVFVCADSAERFNEGLDRLQQQTGEQYIRFNVGAHFGEAAASAVHGEIHIGYTNTKDKVLKTIVPAFCGYFFQPTGYLKKLECCKGPERNKATKAMYHAKADLEDTVRDP